MSNIEIIVHNQSNGRLKNIGVKVIQNQRISVEDGIALYEEASLNYVGTLANHIREQKNGKKTFFNRNFHIEPTNICVFTCNFCSYSRLLKQKEEGWELTIEQMMEKKSGF